MSNRESGCSSQKQLEDIKARRNSPLRASQPQYVGGTGVVEPIPTARNQLQSGQIIQDPTAIQSNQIVPSSALVQSNPSIQDPTSLSQQPSTVPNLNPEALSSKLNFPEGIVTSYPTVGSGGVKIMSNTAANKPPAGQAQKIRISQSGILYTLHMIREPVVEYQETRGIPRNEEITFVTLVTSLCTQAYSAAITILVMLWNLMPLVDGLVYFVRFFLDKLIDIVQTPDPKDKAIKGAIFFGELTVVIFIMFLIVGLIFMPVYVLMARLFSKVFSMIAW